MQVVSCCGILLSPTYACPLCLEHGCPWVGSGNRPVSVSEEQPVPGAAAAWSGWMKLELHLCTGNGGCTGAEAGQACARKASRG